MCCKFGTRLLALFLICGGLVVLGHPMFARSNPRSQMEPIGPSSQQAIDVYQEMDVGEGIKIVKISDTRNLPRSPLRRSRSRRPEEQPPVDAGEGKWDAHLEMKLAMDEEEGTHDPGLAVVPNDACSTPVCVGKGMPTFIQDTTCATGVLSDPLQGCTSGGPAANSNTVWFKFQAPATGFYRIDTCGSSYDTVLSVWDPGCPTPTNELCCNDDKGPGVLQSGVSCCLLQGQTVLIEVSDFGAPGGGNLMLNIACSPKDPPPNDDFVDAIIIPPGPGKFTDQQFTLGATDEPNDPEPSCGAIDDMGSVWYCSTSAVDVDATYDTCGSDYDTVISAYTGSPGAFVEVVCNDDAVGKGSQSLISFTQLAGVTYWIMVTSHNGLPGGNLLFNCCTEELAPPCDAPCVNEDAWTSTRSSIDQSNGECEDYIFANSTDANSIDDDIFIIDKYKVPSAGYPDGVCVDFFFQPCNPKCPDNLEGEDICFPLSTNQNFPVLILNDIYFPPSMFPPNPTPYEVIVATVVDPDCFPTSLVDETYDWWKVVEFMPAGPFLDPHPADCDMDGDFDCGLILNGFDNFPIKPMRDQCNPPFGGNLAFRFTECTDNYGAEVIEFFVNRNNHQLRCLNVFEPHPPLPARSFPGVVPGEDAETRPWCFTIRAETP